MEKVKVFFDQAGFNSWEKGRESLNSDVQQLSVKLAENHICLTAEIFAHFVSEGTNFIWEMLSEQAQKDAKKLEIKSETVKGNLTKGLREKALEFEVLHKKISVGLPKCGIGTKDVEITEGLPVTGKKEIEAKREYFTVYAENEVQHELWTLLKNVSKDLNAIEKILAANKLPSIFKLGFPENFNDYFTVKLAPGVKLSPSGFNMPSEGNVVLEPSPIVIKNLK